MIIANDIDDDDNIIIICLIMIMSIKLVKIMIFFVLLHFRYSNSLVPVLTKL